MPLIQQGEFVGNRTITTAYTNTARYLAPEQVIEDQKPTASSDVYALACVGYEVCTQFTPIHRSNTSSSFSTCGSLTRILKPTARGLLPKYVEKWTEADFQRHDQMGLMVFYPVYRIS